MSAHTDLVNVCVEYLTLSHIPAWINNTGAYKVDEDRKARKKSRYIRFGVPGSSDILGCLPPDGRFLAVECKTGKGEPTKKQLSFLAMVNDAGGLGIVVYELDELIAAVEQERTG